jgi:hypothetical protein
VIPPGAVLPRSPATRTKRAAAGGRGQPKRRPGAPGARRPDFGRRLGTRLRAQTERPWSVGSWRPRAPGRSPAVVAVCDRRGGGLDPGTVDVRLRVTGYRQASFTWSRRWKASSFLARSRPGRVPARWAVRLLLRTVAG